MRHRLRKYQERGGYVSLAALMSFTAITGCVTAPPPGPARLDAQADTIPQPLTPTAGDPGRGREVVLGREANCLFCHVVPETGQRFMGNIGPALAGVGTRLTAGELRLRIVDPTRLNREAVMPAYHKVEGLDRVAPAYRGKPILSAQQVEDVIAYLLTLK